MSQGFPVNRNAWSSGAALYKKMVDKKLPEMINVYLDGTCPMGHQEFADSVNNGPWGHALTKELIAYLEGKFRMDSVPSGRFLTGHSSALRHLASTGHELEST